MKGKEKEKEKSKKTIARKPKLNSEEVSDVQNKVLEEPEYQKTNESKENPVKSSQLPEKQLSGNVDDEGARYLEEIDLLRWQNSVLRIKNLRHQSDTMRQQAENIRLTMETQRAKALTNAGAFEQAARQREKNQHVDLLKEIGGRYGVEFTDTNVVIDEDTGKIKYISPPDD